MNFTLRIGKDGRVLLPKKLREALNIDPGGKLHANFEGGRLIVTSEPHRATVHFEDGFPVIDLANGVRLSGNPVAEARAEHLGRLNAECYLLNITH